MIKTVEEYLALPYTIEITPDDGSFFVKVKELEGCMSVGETRTDALAMIEDAMQEWFTVAIEDGIDIPLPESLQEDRYSGKFPLRLPKVLHRKLAEAAEQNKVSLNQYLVMLLSEKHALHQVKKLLTERDTLPKGMKARVGH
jgi:antitoxin HicB